MELSKLFPEFNRNDYQRDNFDAFLKSVHFHYDIPSIHIAGTNGKGTTASYISKIFQNNGYQVGRFTSPYFYNTNELVSINDIDISDEDLLTIFNENKKLFSKYNLSIFEIETYIALTYFQNKKIDIAIIECGMGGETDATNIFTPILSIITSVSLEHTEYLGRTISEIALNKAGIIKYNVPVIVGQIPLEAEETIASVAKDNKAKVIKSNKPYNIQFVSDGTIFSYGTFEDVKLSSLAEYSTFDASIALEAFNFLKSSWNLDTAKSIAALAEVNMIARMELINNGHIFVIDGGHNLEAIKALCSAMDNRYGIKSYITVFASFRDKNIATMLPELDAHGAKTYITTFNHPRARTIDEYFLFSFDHECEENHVELIKRLKDEERIILVTGSLAFASLVSKEIKDGII